MAPSLETKQKADHSGEAGGGAESPDSEESAGAEAWHPSAPPDAERERVARKNIRIALATCLAMGLSSAACYDRWDVPDTIFTQKLNEGSHYDAVFVGDSRVFRGINPKIVDAVTGWKTYNFGFPAMTLGAAPLDRALQLLDPASHVRVVAIAVSRPSLSQQAEDDNSFVRAEDATELDKMNAQLFGDTEKYFRVNPFALFNHKGNRAVSFMPGGFAYTFGSRQSESYALHDEIAARNPSTWVDPKIVDELGMWIHHATQQGIRVIVFRIPTSRRMYDVEHSLLGLSIESISKKVESEGGTWIDLPPYQKDLTSFDGSHLYGRSANLFSKRLAEKLRVILG